MRQFDMGNQKQSLTIQLSKPHHINGKIVDPTGKPVRDASVYFQTWRGYRTIDANFQTDGSGHFHWNNAPADPITVSVNARNLRGVDNQTLIPDQDNVIKLTPVSHVRGTVTNAQTGKPVDNFQLTFGILWEQQRTVTWQHGWRPNLRTLADGKFDFTNNFSYPGMAVRVEMSGYMPAESRIIKPDEGDVNLDLKLKPAKDIVLTIHGPDGKPVTGATAAMAIPGQQVNIMNGREVQFAATGSQTSGPDGHVDFSPQPGLFAIAIFGDAGSAEVDQKAVAKSADVTLTPWGHVNGQLKVGSKPAAGQDVDLSAAQGMQYEPDKPRIFYQFSAKTDDEGRFNFDRVSPGNYNVSRRINVTSNSWSNTVLQTFDVAAGQTVTVNAGGMGRPVVGNAIIPPDLASRSDWSFMFSQMSTAMDTDSIPAVPVPDDIKTASQEKQQQWFRDWRNTDAGKAWMAAQQKAMAGRRNYAFGVASDGSFHIDDVVAGTYDLTLNLRSNNGQNRMGDVIGIGSARLVVPEMPGGRSDEPLQMDPIPITKLGKYHVGDVVYDLPMKSINGKKLKLSDFRGKYVLLNFRQALSVSAPSPFKMVYNQFGHDSRLAILTLNLNGGLMRNSNILDTPWQQATMDTRGIAWSIIAVDFAVGNNSPSAWLIGPDGKVVAEDLSGDGIMSAVTSALGSPATQPTTMP